MKIKVFKGKDEKTGETYSNAKLPVRKHPGDSGVDAFVCFSDNTKVKEVMIYPGRVLRVPLGIMCEIPDGYEIQLRPRSGISGDGRIAIFGTIDNDYTGVIKANIANLSDEVFKVSEGDRVCQLVVAPVIRPEFVMAEDGESIKSTDRGQNGFGSTGK